MSNYDYRATNPMFDLNYVFESRAGDSRFLRGDVLQLSDLEGEVKIPIFFASSTRVLLGRAPPNPVDSSDETIPTISPEFRQRLVRLAADRSGDRDELDIDTEGKSPPSVLDLRLFGIDTLGVSRRHVLLELDHRYVTLTDLRSTNGTRLNGSLLYPMQRRILRNGDEIQLANLPLRVHFRRLAPND